MTESLHITTAEDPVEVAVERSAIDDAGSFIQLSDGPDCVGAWLNADETRRVRDTLTELLDTAPVPETYWVEVHECYTLGHELNELRNATRYSGEGYWNAHDSKTEHPRAYGGRATLVEVPARIVEKLGDFHPIPEPAPAFALGEHLAPAPAEPEADPDTSLPRRPVGSKAVVLGDAGDWGHVLSDGTVVEIRLDDVDVDGSYWVESEDGASYVAARDLGDYTEPEPRFSVGDRVEIASAPFFRDCGEVIYASESAGIVIGAQGTITDPADEDGDYLIRFFAGEGMERRTYSLAPACLKLAPARERELRIGDRVKATRNTYSQTGKRVPVGETGTVTALLGETYWHRLAASVDSINVRWDDAEIYGWTVRRLAVARIS